MPQDPEKRNDGRHIGPDIREMVRLMLEEGYTWTRAADAVGFNRKHARRALNKPHVTYRRNEKAKLVEDLSMRVPLKLNELMDSDNHIPRCARRSPSRTWQIRTAASRAAGLRPAGL